MKMNESQLQNVFNEIYNFANVYIKYLTCTVETHAKYDSMVDQLIEQIESKYNCCVFDWFRLIEGSNGEKFEVVVEYKWIEWELSK